MLGARPAEAARPVCLPGPAGHRATTTSPSHSR